MKADNRKEQPRRNATRLLVHSQCGKPPEDLIVEHSARSGRQMTRAELAQLMGVHPLTVDRWAKRIPGVEVVTVYRFPGLQDP